MDEAQDVILISDSSDDVSSDEECSVKKTKKCKLSPSRLLDWYNDDAETPVYTRDKNVRTPKDTLELLLNFEDKSKICSAQPLRVQHSCTFIVDVTKLKDPKDIKCDDLGAWKNNSRKSFSFFIDDQDEKLGYIWAISTKDGESRESEGLDILYVLRREYYQLRSSPDFHKRIDTIIKPDGAFYMYCLVQYAFTGEEHSLDLKPHGNCKKSCRGFVRTLESTKQELVKASLVCKPKAAVHQVLRENCKLSEVRSVGAIPKSRRQGSKLLSHKQSDSNTAWKNISQTSRMPRGALSSNDPWYNLLVECKKQGDNATFIRNVQLAPEPSCVLVTNRQLHDLARFCCSPLRYFPLTVDPTFNLGQYNVTIVTYKHLLLKNRRDGRTPCLIGPVMIHNRKTRESYSQLCTTLITLKPDLKQLLAFGTDDEKPLIDAFQTNFEAAVHVLCTRHLKNTFKVHFKSLSVPETIQEEMLNDVFGATWNGVEQKGIIDATSEAESHETLVTMGQDWAAKHPSGLAAYNWVFEKKAKALVEKALAPVRRQAGMGDPPGKFYTNQSERSNLLVQSFVQEETGNKKVDEFVLCKAIELLVERQTTDIELAVTNRGPYEICEEFSFLLIPEDRWVKMNPKQRSNSISKVHSISLSASNEKESMTTTADRHQQTQLERMVLEEGVDWIPGDVLKVMAAKAETTLKTKDNVVIAPGSKNTLVVPSQSCPQSPRLVTQQPSGRITCSCPQYASMSMCSHTLVYAHFFDVFPSYLKWLKCQRRRKSGVNLSNLAGHGMPAGRGRKGEKPARKGKRTAEPGDSQPSTKTLQPLASDIQSVDQDPQSSSMNTAACVHLSEMQLQQSSCSAFSQCSDNTNSPLAPFSQDDWEITHVNFTPQSFSTSVCGDTDLSNGTNTSSNTVEEVFPSKMSHPSSRNTGHGISPLMPVAQFSRCTSDSVFTNAAMNQGQSVNGWEEHSFLLTRENCSIQQSSTPFAEQNFTPSPMNGIAAMQWHSGMSPHRYELRILPKNVHKCYGCGKQFVEKYRRPPYNIIIRHVDRRVRGKDTLGHIILSYDVSPTYYHLDSAHVERKNPLFNKVVFTSNRLFLELSKEQIELVQKGNLILQFPD